MSPHLALLANPTARNGGALRLMEPVVRRLRSRGADVSVIVGDDAADALDRACTAVAERPDALVAFGGDGLVHLALQAVAGTDVPLGIIPAGTGNDIASAFGLPYKDTLTAADVVLGGSPRVVDAARIADEWFAGVVCCGFDSRVNERANRLTRPRGMAKYLVALAQELRSFQPIPFRVVLDEREVLELEAMLVAVGNTCSYGAGMKVCPSALYDDGLLDVTILGAVGKGEFLRTFPRVFKGTHVSHPAVITRRARSVRVEAPDVVAYADGERVGAIPVTCEVVPAALSVLTL
ncbi:diacylglycerol kinase [Nonomuraea soli]|uniref:Diacylglycerol kinase (ATP) n=1 Tax=Nonomuraea soli TaxID=1032476 RepID=A0A7W0CSC4_9ACTN|nr:diacylglycerol kinase [Nonomuraea soli]MBA2896328.1 diacylglycerol kinase (ATP) [Nonomuraea soli]